MPNKAVQTAYLGIGSNLKQPIWQIAQCLTHLNRIPETQVIKIARLYQSKAWGVENQPDFVNTAVTIETKLTPLALLKAVKTIEYRLMQRKLNQRWHSRVIDIDLLLFSGTFINRPNLKIPHPWISERCFVIQPLMDLSADFPTQLRNQVYKHQKQACCLHSLTPIKTPDFIKNRLKLL